MNPLAFALPALVGVLLVLQTIVALFMGRIAAAFGALALAALMGIGLFFGFGLLLAAPAAEQFGYLTVAGFVLAGIGMSGFVVLWWRLSIARATPRDRDTRKGPH
jgi:MFS family permease